MALVLALGLAGPVGAVLVDSFDPPNAAVTATQANQPPPATVIGGGPTGSFLRLMTDGVNDQRNHYSYNRTDPGAYSTVVANFDFAGYSADQPADGLAVLWVPTSIYGTSGVGPDSFQDPNFAGTFGLGFHTYPGGTNSVSVHNNGVEMARRDVAQGDSSFRDGQFNRVHVEMQQMGAGSNVMVQLTNDVHGAGTPTVTAINQYVSGVLPYESRMQFSGRSGGANMTIDLDNIDVQYSNAYAAPPTVPVGSKVVAQNFDSLGTTPFISTQVRVGPGPLVAGGGPTGNYLRLVNDGVNDQRNEIAFDRIADAGAFGTITADFDFRATSVGDAADGFGFLLLPTSQYGTSGRGADSNGFDAEEPNIPGALAIGFDLHPAGSVNDVSVHYNGSQVENVTLNPALINLDIGQFHNAHVAITPLANGSMVKLDLTPDVHGTPGAPVTAFDVFVPTAGYENRVEFAARTGGLNVSVDLDNVNIQYSNPVSLPTVSPTGLYQDFDSLGGTDYAITRAGSSPGPTPVAGDTGYALQLIHDGVNSQNSAIGFDRAADGGVSDSAIVTFDFNANDTNPADGFSMMLLPTNNYGRTGASPIPGPAEKPNLANTLGVGFDFYPNPGTNDVSLHWNGAELATINVPGLDLNNGDTHRAQVSMVQTTGGSNVSISIIPDVNGAAGAPINVLTDHFLPGVFPYDYRVGFAGRTGGANMSVDLDNIVSSQVPGSAGPNLSQNFEGTGQTRYEGHYFSGGSAPALVEEPGNTFLRLLHSQNGTQNAVSFEQTYAGAAAKVDANFDIRFSGNLGADGGSFVLLNTGAYPDVPAMGAWEEPNLAATFGIGFDIYPGTSEVSLHWNGAQVANINTISAFGADMRGAGWLAADLAITYDAAGAYVTLNETNYGIPIYTNQFIAGMQPYESQVVFGGRTGGANTTLDVDNFNVQYTAGGDFIWITNGIGNYVDGFNWDAGTSPSGADNALIPIGQAESTNLNLNGPGVLTMNGGVLNNTGTLYLGTLPGGDGRIVQSGGMVNVNGWLTSVGHAVGGAGQYDMTGGTLNCQDYLLVGREGVGHMTIDGASAQVTTQRLFLAEFAGSDGSSLTINDGRLDVTHADGIRVGTYASATMTQNGGIVDVDRRLHVGHAAGGTGTYNMNGGDLFVREHLVIGVAGTGTFNQSGGVVTQTGGGVYVGDAGTGVGTYNLTDGTLNANFIRVAQWGGAQGTFNQTGGTVNDAGDLFLADGNGAVGTYNISGNAQLNIGGLHTVIGRQGAGHFTQSGTSVVNAQRIFLAEFNGSAGSTYTMNGGTLNATTAATGAFALEVGRGYDATFTLNDGVLNVTNNGNDESMLVGRGGNGVGTFNQNGGQVNVNRRLHLGQDAGGHGIYNLADGTLSVGGNFVIGVNGTGVFTQTGGTVTQTGGSIYMADNAGAEATYNLSGSGVLSTTGELRVGNRDKGTFNMTGGTVTTGGYLRLAPIASGDATFNQSGGTVTSGSRFEMTDTTAGTSAYNLSGDAILNVNNDYFIVGRQGPGHFTQSGTSVVNANLSQRLLIGDFDSADGSSYTMHGGTLNVNGGRQIVVGLNGDATFTQTGGTVNASGRLHVADGGGSTSLYEMSGGQINLTGNHFVVGASGDGTFIQTGGVVNQTAGALYIGDQTGSNGTYIISGGALGTTALRRGGDANNKTTFRVIGSAASINVANEYSLNSADTTIGMAIDSGGISTVNVGTNASLGGHLRMGLVGGVALTEGDSFVLIDAGSIGGNFATKEESVFTTAQAGTQYIATLAAALGQGTVTAAGAGGPWDIAFPKANQGWVQIDDAESWPTLELLLDLDFEGALPGNDLDALIAFIDEAGFGVEKIENSRFDLKLLTTPHPGDYTSFFSWDFADFDPNVGIKGIGANIPEPATLTLLGVGLLAALRRRRRS